MPTIEDFQFWAGQAKQDAKEYRQWSEEAADAKLKSKYIINADKRLDDARFYERQAKELQERQARKSERILPMISASEKEEDSGND